eukprot:768420-Hanusia_phi.AAC.1
MFWREDPRGGKAGSKPDWPRNGAVLKGKVHVLDKPVEGNKQWLEVRLAMLILAPSRAALAASYSPSSLVTFFLLVHLLFRTLSLPPLPLLPVVALLYSASSCAGRGVLSGGLVEFRSSWRLLDALRAGREASAQLKEGEGRREETRREERERDKEGGEVELPVSMSHWMFCSYEVVRSAPSNTSDLV